MIQGGPASSPQVLSSQKELGGRALGSLQGEGVWAGGGGGHILVDCAVLLRAVLRQEAVGVLVHAQIIERGEVLATEVAAIAQLLLVALDMLQKGVELWERLRTALDHTLVYLEGRRHRPSDGRQMVPLSPCSWSSVLS